MLTVINDVSIKPNTNNILQLLGDFTCKELWVTDVHPFT